MLVVWTNAYRASFTMKMGKVPVYNTDKFTCAEGDKRNINKLLRGGIEVVNAHDNGKDLEVDEIPELTFGNDRVFVSVRKNGKKDSSGHLIKEATFIVDKDYYLNFNVNMGICYVNHKPYGVIAPPVISGDSIYCPVYTIHCGALTFVKNATIDDEEIFTYHKNYLNVYRRRVLFE